MPKGDYRQLKADIEDGTVPIAHLLLEAASMAKLNGVAKGLLMFIWRRTYGWANGKQKHKDDRITLAEFAQATSSAKTYVSTQLKLLVKQGIVMEKVDPDNARYKRYGMQTEVNQWSSEVIDIDELQEAIDSRLYLHSTRGSTLTVQQSRNGLVNAEGLANAEPFSDTLTKPFSDHETFRFNFSSNGAVFETSKESIEINKDLSGCTQPHEKEYRKAIFQTFERSFGRAPAPVLIDDLYEFTQQGMDLELVANAIRISRDREKSTDYLKGILQKQLDRGIRTVEQAEEQERQYRARSPSRSNVGARNKRVFEKYGQEAREDDDEQGDFIDIQASVRSISATSHRARDT